MRPDASHAPRVWRIPMLLAAGTASGLLSALVADGWGDAWAWCALGAPLVVAAACWRRAVRAHGRR